MAVLHHPGLLPLSPLSLGIQALKYSDVQTPRHRESKASRAQEKTKAPKRRNAQTPRHQEADQNAKTLGHAFTRASSHQGEPKTPRHPRHRSIQIPKHPGTRPPRHQDVQVSGPPDIQSPRYPVCQFRALAGSVRDNHGTVLSDSAARARHPRILAGAPPEGSQPTCVCRHASCPFSLNPKERHLETVACSRYPATFPYSWADISTNE